VSAIREVTPLSPQAGLDEIRQAVAGLIEYVRTREPLSVGDSSLKFATLQRLVEVGLLTQTGTGVPGGGGGYDPGPGTGGGYDPDPSPPDPITGLTAGAAISHHFLSFDVPNYPQGHGNAYTEIYGANYSGTGPLPVFTDAVLVGTIAGKGNFGAIPCQPGQTTHYWAGAVTVDGTRQVDGVGPSGGLNGVPATSAADMRAMLAALTAAALGTDGTYSRILFRADLFGVGPELDFNQEATPTATATNQLWFKPSTGVTTRWDGAAWSAFDVPLPFIVNTSPTVINGVTIPAGVYMDSAFIYDLTAAIARLGNAWIDNLMVANISVDKLTGNELQVGSFIQSNGYTGSGTNEWRIDSNGTARFVNGIFSGTITATAGAIGGISIFSNHIESSGYNGTTTGFRLDGALGKIFAYEGEFGGALVAATGSFVGTVQIGSSPLVSGTSMTGTGAVFNPSGTWAAGNSTKNISFNGTTVTINGALVVTDNLVPEAVTVQAAAFTTGSITGGFASWTTIQSITIDSTGAVVLLLAGFIVSEVFDGTYAWRLTRDGTVVFRVGSGSPGIGAKNSANMPPFTDLPGSGSHTYNLDVIDYGDGTLPLYCYDRGLYAIEIKR
jgi:hypothetical protein